MSIRRILKGVAPLARLNELVKAPLQEFQASLALAAYQRRALELGIEELGDRDLAEALRRRLARRPHPPWPKALGSLHIFVAYYVNNWEHVLPMALAPFGRVSEFNWRAHGFNESSANWLVERDVMNEAMLAAFRQASAMAPVDAVVGYLSGHNTDPWVLRAMAAEGAAIFNFCWDDTLAFPGKLYGGRYPSPAALAADVDLNLTNVPAHIVKYRVHGGLAAFMPEGADPLVNRPYDCSFQYDVSFVGARYGWRPRFIRELENRGIHVECFGPGWPHGPLPFDEMVKLYSLSRVNLGFAGIGHSKKLCCLKGRDFEVPMSEGLYLTQEHPDLHRVYEVGREVLTYTDADECAERSRWVLSHPKEAAAIRAAGRERCLRDHTYQACWTKVFRMAGVVE